MGLKTNIVNRKPEVIGQDVIEVWSESDFGVVTPGISIVPVANAAFDLKAPITQTLPFIIGSGNSMQLLTSNRVTNTLTYTNAVQAQFQGTNIGTLSFVDVVMNGNSTGSIFNINGGVISAKFPDFNRYANAGTVQNLDDFFSPGVVFDVISGGISLTNCSAATFIDCLILALDGNAFSFFNVSGASSGDIQILDNIMQNDSQSSFVYIDSSFPTTNVVSVNGNNTTVPSNFFGAGSLTQTDNRLIVTNNKAVSESVVSIEGNLFNNVLTTSNPAAGAIVLINSTGWVEDEASKLVVSTTGQIKYLGSVQTLAKVDGNVSMEPVSSSKLLSSRFILEKASEVTVTFTNATNLINDTATALVNGDVITFNKSSGTLPAQLRKDIVYYVVNQLTNSFQVSYTLGGAAITFTDDGTPANTYSRCELHGSVPQNTIAANSQRGLIPQALENIETNDIIHMTVTNNDDAVDILVKSAYMRMRN